MKGLKGTERWAQPRCPGSRMGAALLCAPTSSVPLPPSRRVGRAANNSPKSLQRNPDCPLGKVLWGQEEFSTERDCWGEHSTSIITALEHRAADFALETQHYFLPFTFWCSIRAIAFYFQQKCYTKAPMLVNCLAKNSPFENNNNSWCYSWQSGCILFPPSYSHERCQWLLMCFLLPPTPWNEVVEMWGSASSQVTPTGQEVMALSCARWGSGWTIGNIYSQKEYWRSGMAAQGGGGVTVHGGVTEPWRRGTEGTGQ